MGYEYRHRPRENKMSHITFTELRHDMAGYLDQVSDGGAPLIVTRQDGKSNVVIITEDEYAGWQETVHLLSNPKNAAHLVEAVRQARAGETEEHALIQSGPEAA